MSQWCKPTWRGVTDSLPTDVDLCLITAYKVFDLFYTTTIWQWCLSSGCLPHTNRVGVQIVLCPVCFEFALSPCALISFGYSGFSPWGMCTMYVCKEKSKKALFPKVGVEEPEWVERNSEVEHSPRLPHLTSLPDMILCIMYRQIPITTPKNLVESLPEE